MSLLEVGHYQILLCSPEALATERWRAVLQHDKKEIQTIVVDEAHCIEQW